MNWDQLTGLVNITVSSCISLLVFGILRISAGTSQLVKMSGQKLQVEHSKCKQGLSPGSAPNKPASKGMPWGWPALECAASRKASENLGITEKDRLSWQHQHSG